MIASETLEWIAVKKWNIKKPHVHFNKEKWLITCLPYGKLFVNKILIIISIVENVGIARINNVYSLEYDLLML